MGNSGPDIEDDSEVSLSILYIWSVWRCRSLQFSFAGNFLKKDFLNPRPSIEIFIDNFVIIIYYITIKAQMFIPMNKCAKGERLCMDLTMSSLY